MSTRLARGTCCRVRECHPVLRTCLHRWRPRRLLERGPGAGNLSGLEQGDSKHQSRAWLVVEIAPLEGPGQPGGRIEKEGTMHVSNVMLVCPKCDKPTRIAHKIKEIEIAGEKKQKSVRVCKNCGKVID